MQSRLGLEIKCIWGNGEWHLIIQSRRPLWNILPVLGGEYFSVSHAVCLPACLPMQTSLHAVRVYWYFCLRLSDCEHRNDWNSPLYLRDNSRWEGETRQRRGWKSVYPFSFSSRLKCGRCFFILSG